MMTILAGFMMFMFLVALKSWIILILYLVGFTITVAVLHVIGERNPRTIGGSFSGDADFDMSLALIWPVFMPMYVLYKSTKWIFSSLHTEKE